MKQETVELPVEILPHAAGLPLPAYMSAGAAGMDLYAAVKEAGISRAGSGEADSDRAESSGSGRI